MYRLFFFLILFPAVITSQSIKNFEGHWAGSLTASSGAEFKTIASMQLVISPGDSANTWHYKMIYNDKDIRDYILKCTDPVNSKYAIDEKNGIILSQDLFGNKFISAFEINDVFLFISLERENDLLIFEVCSMPGKLKRKSGQGNEESPFVYSYPAANFQRAELKRL